MPNNTNYACYYNYFTHSKWLLILSITFHLILYAFHKIKFTFLFSLLLLFSWPLFYHFLVVFSLFFYFFIFTFLLLFYSFYYFFPFHTFTSISSISFFLSISFSLSISVSLIHSFFFLLPFLFLSINLIYCVNLIYCTYTTIHLHLHFLSPVLPTICVHSPLCICIKIRNASPYQKNILAMIIQTNSQLAVIFQTY